MVLTLAQAFEDLNAKEGTNEVQNVLWQANGQVFRVDKMRAEVGAFGYIYRMYLEDIHSDSGTQMKAEIHYIPHFDEGGNKEGTLFIQTSIDLGYPVRIPVVKFAGGDWVGKAWVDFTLSERPSYIAAGVSSVVLEMLKEV